MFTVEINNDGIEAGLQRLSTQLADTTAVMGRIAKHLAQSTEDRFATGKSPDGVNWAAKSPVTLQAYGARKSNRIDSRPLFGPSGDLHSTIGSDYGVDFAEISSARPYAAMMQFGGTRAAFPNLWGDIPARPFFGISEADEASVLDIIAEALSAGVSAASNQT